jgi:hypothetical protein
MELSLSMIEREKQQPSKLRIGHKVIPCFAHIGKQRLDLLVHQTAGHFLDRLTNLHSNRITDFLSLLSRRFHHVDVETERKNLQCRSRARS